MKNKKVFSMDANMKSTIIKGILIGALSGFCGLASATVYNVNLAVGTGSAIGTITTDGITGVLGNTDILDWNIVLNGNPGNIFTLLGPTSGSNSNFIQGGNSFTATGTTLDFNFSSSGFALFQNPSNGSGINYLCFAGQVCGEFGNAINLGTNVFGVNTSPQTGIQVVATTAVPEPETYGMMLAGLGLMGFIVRRKKTA
jgi:hypothetical protein